MNKNCIKCKIDKSLLEYAIYNKTNNARLNVCKSCIKKYKHMLWVSGRSKVYEEKRKNLPERKRWQREANRKMSKKYPKRKKCRNIFSNKFRYGNIPKSPCEVCGTSKLVQAHHSDYNKPFDVMWLCCYHHKEWHKNNKAILPF